MYTSAKSRFINTCFIAYKRGNGCLGVTFTLIVNESTNTELPADMSRPIKVAFDTPNTITVRIKSPYFDIKVPDNMNNFMAFAIFLQSRISDKIDYIIENIKMCPNQQLCSIIVSGKSHVFNTEEDSMDQVPYLFTYTHVVGEQLLYADIAEALSTHFRLNLIYFDEFLTKEESDYTRDYKSSEIRRRRQRRAISSDANIESE